MWPRFFFGIPKEIGKNKTNKNLNIFQKCERVSFEPFVGVRKGVVALGKKPSLRLCL